MDEVDPAREETQANHVIHPCIQVSSLARWRSFSVDEDDATRNFVQ